MSDNESNESNESRETVADIVAEMRRGTKLPGFWSSRDLNKILEYHADRIEAAAKRDEERAVEHATRHAEAVARDNCRDCVYNPRGKNYEGGNAAAMREALMDIRKAAESGLSCIFCGNDCISQLWQIVGLCDAALSKPARNCDVGTPQEQTRRMFEQYCSEQISCYELPSGEHCPLHCTGVDCRLAWAQMPYVAQEGVRE